MSERVLQQHQGKETMKGWLIKVGGIRPHRLKTSFMYCGFLCGLLVSDVC